MKLTRTALAAGLAIACACDPPPPVSAAASSVRIVAPAPGRTLSEEYPAPAVPEEPVRAAVFEQINEDRAAAGLPPVAWDEGAARVADAFCAQQVAEKTRGHYLRNGIPPYARTALAGVFGYHAQNSSSWITTAASFRDPPRELALSGHRSMIEETPPDDGHRRTILDPMATHVGVGWATGGGRFQLSQEFLARGLDRLSLTTDARGATVLLRGAARPPWTIRFVTVRPLSPGTRRTRARPTATRAARRRSWPKGTSSTRSSAPSRATGFTSGTTATSRFLTLRRSRASTPSCSGSCGWDGTRPSPWARP